MADMNISQTPETTLNQNDAPALRQNSQPTLKKPLRLWPGIVAVVLQWLLWFVLPIASRDSAIVAILGGVACGLVVVVWWLFFSRAPWVERVGAIVLMVVAVVVTKRVVHLSIANGMMGMMLPVFVIPFFSLALVAAAAGGRRLTTGPRRALMAAAILIACGAWTLVRTGGITGDAFSDLHWRWTKTPEERLLAQPGDQPLSSSAPASAAVKTGADWPGFRGPDRDGIVHGVRIQTDWSKSPPVELWRQPIGPGWSSFAVHGDVFYTQEQRGDDELVSCYNVTTGKAVWRHRDAARFWESNGGAGPRGTPTLSGGRVYTLGATGILNALDAGTGAVVWSRNAASDTKAKLPGWGFSSSPLVVGNLVVVATAGTLAAYDLATGEPRWFGPNGGGGYSSPQLVTIQGVPQILLLGATGATSVTSTDGKLLWQHPLPSGARIVQPAMTAEGDVLLHDGEGSSLRRISLANGPGGWTAAERWASDGLNPYFSDFVVHKGHAFGFSNSSIACIDLNDGSLKWKGGSYGHGQLVLLADEDLLLVLTEEGELALVGATTDQFKELGRAPAIKGKTWNHPVLAGDVVLVRNAEEMAAFRLTLAGN
ncbi:MAG TPA: PQQ-binding-like beta-propeller repeat protein [Pyrinomonadaceae bacterium]|jgi:outer membrane protein assembly factor BamB|nr:PQQ-binding-like beta-propeller repeat protein [Pyrinomonadaceae bacterium]